MKGSDNVLCCYAAAYLEGIHWPAMVDIATVIGIKPSSVHVTVARLVDRGFLIQGHRCYSPSMAGMERARALGVS